jgi:class 3 adenylate cyclase/tetratricopeptide (TPR) repeat protein
VICPNCASENEAGAKFCNDCGAPLTAGCPNCGATNKPGARFCNECGTALASGTSPAQAKSSPAAASVAERRLVTVLFADIVGFTPFAEERDAEEVRDTLTRYFDLCAETIERYGGTVEKFIGDAVMAVWGAPIAHEDDAERAVRAALELVQAVPSLGPGTQARAGVLTGEAAVTIGATNQGMVAGDIVNTAARLQSAAPAGTVLVGEATFRAAGDAIAFEQAGDQVLKGKVAPVPAWRATRVVAERGGRNRSEQLEAPFIGRADELRLLKDLFHATGREQKARLVSVIGPAGIGKSRLAWEFLKYVDGLVETTYWHDGRAPAYGEGISFWALGEMIRGRAGLVETDDEATTRDKVAASVAQWITDADERQWIERALLALLGIEARLAPEELFAAWRTFFERISEHGTVTLVFEDMHIADSGLLDFIDHMLEWSRSHPIYIVTLARPELIERRPDWGAGKRSFTSLYLEPLTSEQMRELLAGLVPGLPAEAAATIVARADGVPLYAVETVRMLVADGRLEQRDGAFVPVGDLTTLAVPDTLMALVRSRLDGLPDADRTLVHDAAVLGQSFNVPALAAVSGVSADAVESRLRGLVRRELMLNSSDPRSPERGQYAFVQALTREVAYNTLSKSDRKIRHLAAARFFEQLGSDELAGALAGHYLAAHSNAGEPAERAALAAHARVALKAAAERAAALGSFEQALRFLEQAIEITTDPPDIAALHDQAGEAALHGGRFEGAKDHHAAAANGYSAIGNRTAAARATAARAWAMLEARQTQAAIELMEPANGEYAAELTGDVAAYFKRIFGRALSQSTRNREALVVAEEALEIAENVGLLKETASLLVLKGISLQNLGRRREAIALVAGAEDLARSNGWDDVLTAALTVMSAMAPETDPRRGWAAVLEAADIARRAGRRDALVMAVGNVAYTSLQQGEWDIGLAQADPLAADPDVAAGQGVYLWSNTIIIHANRGDDVEASLAELDRLVKSAGEIELEAAAADAHANRALAMGDYKRAAENWRLIARIDPQQVSWGHYQAARCELWEGHIDALRADLEATTASGIHGPTHEARLLTMRAGVAVLEGREEEALHLYQASLDAWRAMGLVWDEALTGLDMVFALDPTLPEIRTVAESTSAILTRLRARPFLERLEAAMAARPSQAMVSERDSGSLVAAEQA